MRQVLVSEPGGRDSETVSEALCLLTNLTCDPAAARSLGEPRGLRMLFRRAFASHNPLLMRFLRNLASFEEIRPHFLVRLESLAPHLLGNQLWCSCRFLYRFCIPTTLTLEKVTFK